jgi:hypothetical protein
MKYIKMLGLAAVVTAAFMAFAGSASATITGPTAGTKPTTLHATGSTASKDPSFLLEAGFAEITCTDSTVFGDVTKNETLIAKGPVTALTFTGCGSATVDVLALGELEVTANSGGGSGTVKGYSQQVTTAVLGTSCVYGTLSTGTTLGTITAGTPGKMPITATLPKISGGFLCANPAKWNGTYTVTSPSTLLIDD